MLTIRPSGTSQHQIERAGTAMAGMRWAYRRNPPGVVRCGEPVSDRCTDATTRMRAITLRAGRAASDEEEQPITAQDSPRECLIKRVISTVERVAVKIDAAIWRDQSTRKAAVPARVERGAGRGRTRRHGLGMSDRGRSRRR
ncbi:MAG: hypothetical protein A4S16_09550 [Proteobacteria bacterium SG_bin6]|nr:MAG: hypothetical protein A4S16_09550 [Proteobacteria bacterium SG_bin6]